MYTCTINGSDLSAVDIVYTISTDLSAVDIVYTISTAERSPPLIVHVYMYTAGVHTHQCDTEGLVSQNVYHWLFGICISDNTRHCSNGRLMSANRLRYWPNIMPISSTSIVLAIRRFGVVQCNIILAHNPTTITYILYTNRFTT